MFPKFCHQYLTSHSVTQTSNAHAHTSDGCALCMRIRWGTTRYEPKDKVILGEGKGWLAKILKPHLNFISCCAPVSNTIFVDVCFLVRSSECLKKKKCSFEQMPTQELQLYECRGTSPLQPGILGTLKRGQILLNQYFASI